MKLVKSFGDSGLLMKRFIEIIKNEIQEQNRGILGMLLGT